MEAPTNIVSVNQVGQREREKENGEKRGGGVREGHERTGQARGQAQTGEDRRRTRVRKRGACQPPLELSCLLVLAASPFCPPGRPREHGFFSFVFLPWRLNLGILLVSKSNSPTRLPLRMALGCRRVPLTSWTHKLEYAQIAILVSVKAEAAQPI